MVNGTYFEIFMVTLYISLEELKHIAHTRVSIAKLRGAQPLSSAWECSARLVPVTRYMRDRHGWWGHLHCPKPLK